MRAPVKIPLNSLYNKALIHTVSTRTLHRPSSPDHKQIFETSSNNNTRLVQNTFFYCFDFYIVDHQQRSTYHKEGTHT
ncbi:hypothetical protein BDR06DRAFT_236552 [Suillus hirtellus]|nr:hypothetical protein BDR06DRAFT_236552 [Suillus hirtellus]